jgi:hypothetical protein
MVAGADFGVAGCREEVRELGRESTTGSLQGQMFLLALKLQHAV